MQKVDYQHGDVMLTKVEKEPEGLAWKQAEKGFIVERGEGLHTHEMTDICEFAEKDGVLYVRPMDGKKFSITHEEHGEKVLEPGIYKKHIELEYDAESDEVVRTRD